MKKKIELIKPHIERVRTSDASQTVFISGYSMLQGGPLPCFMAESLLMKLFSDQEGLSIAERQLKDGFATFGLVEV